MFETQSYLNMQLNIDHYEKDLLLECIQFRLDNDKILVINNSLRNEIEDLLAKVEEECV
jgi:antitoxin component of MazEF toxin-antitoxin module